MTRRRLPRPSEVRRFLRLRPMRGTRLERRLAGAATIADLRRIARRRTPRAVFDYVDGAAEEELSLRRARSAFSRVEFVPRVLRDVSAVDASTMILGQRSALPLVLAPTGFTRLMNHEGEPAVARAAQRAGIPTPSRRWARPRQRHWRRPCPKRSSGSSSTSGATAPPAPTSSSEPRRRAMRR